MSRFLYAASRTASVLLIGLCLAAASLSAAAAPTTERGQLVHKIVLKWGPHVAETYRADLHEWARALTPVMLRSDLDALRKAADARTFDAMNNALLGDAVPQPMSLSADSIQGLALGSEAQDLVLVPITPCRIFDTRKVGGAGPIPANATRDFDVADVTSYAAQGGADHNCGGVGAAGSFAAAVINFTVVDPASGGFITAYPYGVARPNAATVNYNAGHFVSNNLGVVKLDQSAAEKELTVYSYARAHVVADIVGYFIAPQPTALECLYTAANTKSIGPNQVDTAFAHACPAGYTETSTGCLGSYDISITGQGDGHCAVRNLHPTQSGVVHASRKCCRVPGR